MNKFVVNRDSWHYRWLMFYLAAKSMLNYPTYFDSEYNTPRDFVEDNYILPNDFCSYWRATIVFPAIRIGINLLVFIFIGIGLWVTRDGFSAVIQFSLTLTAMLFFGVLTFIAFSVWKERRKDKKKIKQPKQKAEENIFSKAYSAYKEKYCPMVDYEDSK